MKRVIACLLPTTVLLCGCNFEFGTSLKPQILVVDPVPVAKSLGRDETMQKMLNTEIDKLNASLEQQARELTSQLEKEKQKLGKKPDEEATRRYQLLVSAATQKARQSQLQAQQSASTYRQSLLAEFNAEIRATAGKIAKERHATSVLITGENVLWYDPTADITAEVIEKLRTTALQNQDEAATSEAAHSTELKNLESVIQSIQNNDRPAP